MAFWIDNLTGVTANNRALIKSYLLPNGQLKAEGWAILANSVYFEDETPITAQDIKNWASFQMNMTCNQMRVIIDSIKVNGNLIPVEYPPLMLIEMDMKTYSLDDNHNKTVWYNRGTAHSNFKVKIKIPEFHIKNFDLIKEAKPYLVIERWKPGNHYGKSGWRRANPMLLGQTYHDGWATMTNIPITQTDMYRPNNIPITSAKMSIDIFAENYIQNSRGNKNFPTFVGTQNKRNDPNGSNSFDSRQRIPLRFKIGVKINGVEYLTPTLIETNIYICKIKEDDGQSPNGTLKTRKAAKKSKIVGRVDNGEVVGDGGIRPDDPQGPEITPDMVFVLSYGKI